MVYLDNGATSFPKAPGVGKAMCEFVETIGMNIGRGSYAEALDAQRVVLDCREKLLEIFNAPEGCEVIFTKNVTESLNLVLKGLLCAGDHAVTSSVEHNAVMRPLTSLSKRGISFTKAECDIEGNLSLDSLKGAIRSNTRCIVMTHASNVCGTVLDLDSVGAIAAERGIDFVVDAAQTAGVIDIDMKALNASAVCFTGHKGLLGPQGIGGIIMKKEFGKKIGHFIEGGTGSASDSEEQPDSLPDKFESGTQNLPGIFGLNAAIDFIMETGISKIREKELAHTALFLKSIEGIEGVRVVGKSGIDYRTAVVSLDFLNRDNAEMSYELDTVFDIKCRVGMHCAPSAHRTLGTFPQGTVRFSFSYFNKDEDVLYAADSVRKLLEM